VRLDLDGSLSVTGQFTGVDVQGCLQLRLADATTRTYPPHQVRLLRDIL
jgi:hypothetical protein